MFTDFPSLYPTAPAMLFSGGPDGCKVPGKGARGGLWTNESNRDVGKQLILSQSQYKISIPNPNTCSGTENTETIGSPCI